MKAPRLLLILGALCFASAPVRSSAQIVAAYEPLPKAAPFRLLPEAGPSSVFDIMLLDEYVVRDDSFAPTLADERRNRELERIFAKRQPPKRDIRLVGDRDLPMGLDTGISDLTVAAWKLRNTVTDFKVGDTTVTVHGRIGLVFPQGNDRAWIIGRKNKNTGFMHSYDTDRSASHMLRYGLVQPIGEIVPFTLKAVTFPFRKLGSIITGDDGR